MKVIERPESTTYMLEFPFHYIKDEKEVSNIFRGKSKDEIFIVGKRVDVHTYRPQLALAIKKENLPFSQWEKYLVDLELYAETYSLVV